jgi:D-tagatose-1,6-bisphosphate aldolase subunit GatZ/KbaZ
MGTGQKSQGVNGAQTALVDLVRRQKRGEPAGIYSVCSSNRFVLEAALVQALQDGSPVLIESTSNQVNQYGGYMGMNPRQFADHLASLAGSCGIPTGQVILGGDHLGPNVWRNEPAASAMIKAEQLVRDCVFAGYTKLHLDASMKLGGDRPEKPLDPEVSARRAAQLCRAAEQASADLGPAAPAPVYVIGTEVPPPGGVQGEEGEIAVTRVVDAAETIHLAQEAFHQLGLASAWERVAALVVQPGVEYGNTRVHEYDRVSAAGLSRFIHTHETIVYEAHSTDYQTRAALEQLVEDGFAILKVGPALTFAFREAVLALEMIEQEWMGSKPGMQRSNVRQALEQAMLKDPRYWEGYYLGSDHQARFSRVYSLSDRIRYYWPVPEVEAALRRLLANLSAHPVPLTLLSQFLPTQYHLVRQGLLADEPRAWIHHKIRTVLADYAFASGMAG